jgi:hypothetical protein
MNYFFFNIYRLYLFFELKYWKIIKLVLYKLSKVYHVMMENETNESSDDNNNNNNNFNTATSVSTSLSQDNNNSIINNNNNNNSENNNVATSSKIYNQQVFVTQKLASTGIGLYFYFFFSSNLSHAF